MEAEIITIGDELLIGQTVNTNSAWIAEQLNLLGIKVLQITTIRDTEEHIVDTLNHATNRVGLIVITGGLGPTNDDITKETLADYFNTKLVFNKDVYARIEEKFMRRGIEILPTNRSQAMLPEDCTILENSRGTASGMLFYKNEKIFISLPGVPYEMKGIMSEQVLPLLKTKINGDEIVHKTVKTTGMGESSLANVLENWEKSLDNVQVKLAYLPSPGMVKLRLTRRGNSRDESIKVIENKIQELIAIIPELVFGYDKEELEEVVGKLLKDKKATLAIAESCTGGNIAHLITSVPGSSDYFLGGIVSYANDVKLNQLGVLQQTLQEAGAVSEEVVIQMAKGVLKRLNADYAIATSGIAGPAGGTEDKPVGTVWIAIANKNTVIAKKYIFGKSRERNILVSSYTALNLLRIMLLD